MARSFEVPHFYKSPLISRLKKLRVEADPRRKNLSPSHLISDELELFIARHFGFCYGVENAIEIAWKAISEHKDRRIFLLSEMIHNPEVNADLIAHGAQFLMDTAGNILVPFEQLHKDDIVIVPAFGTTVELQEQLASLGIDPYQYDTTCPFVERVWRRSNELGSKGFSVVVHGKRSHEETRATFSHSAAKAPTIIVRDIEDARLLASLISQEADLDNFHAQFANAYTGGFDPNLHLERIGVVNQTTMLASETESIAECLKDAMQKRYGEKNLSYHFADTRDTLCYATNENQGATMELVKHSCDLALVIGGYNSSNTSHLVEICEQSLPTFYIKNCDELVSDTLIRHYSLSGKTTIQTKHWLPRKAPLKIAITSGASCPDSNVDAVILRLSSLLGQEHDWHTSLDNYRSLLMGSV